MSNRNHQNPANQNNGGNNAPAQDNGAKEKKPGLLTKARKAYDKAMSHKWVRGLVGGLKIAGVGTGLVLSYKAGVKSVKPTTVYIREGVTEEPENEEQETKEEPAEDEAQE
jgi:hypothetical protein